MAVLLLKVTLNIQNVCLSEGQFPQGHKKDQRKEGEDFAVLILSWLPVKMRTFDKYFTLTKFSVSLSCKMDLLKLSPSCIQLSVYLPSFLTQSSTRVCQENYNQERKQEFLFRMKSFYCIGFLSDALVWGVAGWCQR